MNRNFPGNNIAAYSYPNPGNNLVDMNNFQLNRGNMQGPPINNSFINLNLSNPLQKQFYVSYLPDNGNNKAQALPDSGSGPEKTEEEEEEYAPGHLA